VLIILSKELEWATPKLDRVERDKFIDKVGIHNEVTYMFSMNSILQMRN
jgi:hypothetical protein